MLNYKLLCDYKLKKLRNFGFSKSVVCRRKVILKLKLPILANDEPAKRLYLAKPPTYSPEVDADEQVWSQIKTVGLKNSCYQSIKELKSKIIKEFEKLKNKPELIKQFFRLEDVGFYN